MLLADSQTLNSKLHFSDSIKEFKYSLFQCEYITQWFQLNSSKIPPFHSFTFPFHVYVGRYIYMTGSTNMALNTKVLVREVTWMSYFWFLFLMLKNKKALAMIIPRMVRAERML